MIRRSPLHRPTKRKHRAVARCSVRGCKRPPKIETTKIEWSPSFIAEGKPSTERAARLCLTHAKREADRLFSLRVRGEGACGMCGKRDGLQCSHFISRRYLGTRWIRLNAECLCVGCHKFLTERPIEARDRARELLGATVYDELEERARRFVGPVDYAAIIADLGARAALSEETKEETHG